MLLALLVVILWGANFTVIRMGLDGIPPLLLVTLRYAVAALPALFLIKRPLAVSWRYLIIYGLTVGVGQFSCLFYAMNIGLSAGTASVILQSQVFFTALFASLLLKEPLKLNHIVGLCTAIIGLILISGILLQDNMAIPLPALIIALAGAAFWAISNIIVRFASNKATQQGQNIDMFALIVWSSLIPPIPLLFLSTFLDSPSVLMEALRNLNGQSIFSVLYLAVAATWFGYGVWSYLLAKYPTAKVAPLSLLVPVTGLFTANLVLGEELTLIQWLGCAIIFLGLAIANCGSQLTKLLTKSKN